MSDDGTPGVLLRGADGNHFFIPHTDLSKYALDSAPETGDAFETESVHVEAVAVQQSDDAGATAFMPMPEGGAAAFMPMPEG